MAQYRKGIFGTRYTIEWEDDSLRSTDVVLSIFHPGFNLWHEFRFNAELLTAYQDRLAKEPNYRSFLDDVVIPAADDFDWDTLQERINESQSHST